MRIVALSVLAAVGVFGLGAAFDGELSAKEKDLQHQEVDGNLDLNIVSLGNEALIGLKYIYTFQGIDRNDEIPPILRRFLLHPAAIWANITHDGGTREAITTIQLGGEIYPFDGLLYLRVEGGVGRHLTIFDEPYEFGYFFGTLYGEVGFRPVNGLQIGAFYRGSPIIEEDLDGITAQQAQRSGTEQNFGATVTFATPNDRLFGTVSVYGVVDDYTFTNCTTCLFPGPETVRGFGGSAKLAYQLNLSTSIQVGGSIERDHWVDSRINEENHFVNGNNNIQDLNLDRQVLGGVASADFIYWYTGRYGFRLSVGGGYQQAAPLLNDRGTAIIRFGGGVTLRF